MMDNNNMNEMDGYNTAGNTNEMDNNNTINNMSEMDSNNTVNHGNSEESSSNTQTGASGSVYSYSYLNQENQERNPNYYEKKEEAGYQDTSYNNASANRTERTYTAGRERFYTNNQGMNGGQSYSGGNTYNSGQTYGNGNSYGGGYPYNNGQPYGNGQAQNNWNSMGNAAAPTKKKQKKQKAPKEKKQYGFGMTVAKCAALALVFGLVSSTVFYGTGLAFKYTTGSGDVKTESSTDSKQIQEKAKDNNSNGSLSATSVSTATTVTDVSDIVDNVMPSIVSITNMGQQAIDYFFGQRIMQDTESAGSGIIIDQTDDEIYIATNNHVVANSNQLTVNFIDDQTVAAEIKGTDSSTDLAVISVKVKDIPSETLEKIKVATLGDSDNIKVGQSAVAIGNALGYGQSVTTGVISAVDREVTVEDDFGTAITNDLIQTDAAINPGNSGGALLNMNGEVIGINSVKYSDTQVEGMGYAIPISAAEPIINNLITREVVDESNSSYLGVSGQDVTSELAKNFGMPEGLYVTLVKENSAAAQAGIQKGDVITKFDGRAVKSMDSLSEIMQYYAAGTEVEITIQTNVNGEWVERNISVKLGRKND